MRDDQALIDVFIAQAGAPLTEFAERHEFGEPTSIVDRRISQVRIMLKKREIAVEVSYDYREGDIELFVARLENGEVPEGWMVDARGRRFRFRVLELLLARGVRSLGLEPKGSESLEERYRRIVARFLSLIEEHIPEVLDGFLPG
ncbi:MAG TPA: hypothetical protein VMR86_06145 [Myxococcota bacterium]|nr:hypothetical protein [Myxococcota bacterium]